jgi:hypothetical protein
MGCVAIMIKTSHWDVFVTKTTKMRGPLQRQGPSAQQQSVLGTVADNYIRIQDARIGKTGAVNRLTS